MRQVPQHDGWILFLLGALLLTGVGVLGADRMGDLRTLFYAGRCMVHGIDPYQQSNVVQAYQAGAAERAHPDPIPDSSIPDATSFVYFPNAAALVAPLAFLSWPAAHWLWMLLVLASLTAAAWRMATMGARWEPRLSYALGGWTLAFSMLIPWIGNISTLTICLCVFAAVSFYESRGEGLGVLCLAAALALKPHDAGMIWLFFLLAGAPFRRRAFQSAALFFLLSAPGLFWMMRIAPHWPAELLANLHVASQPGGWSDPSPANHSAAASVPSLLTVFACFVREPRMYSLLTWLVVAPLWTLWAVATLRRPPTGARYWTGLAAIGALSLLPVYHRLHDAKLLVFAIPVCAALWSRQSRLRWPAAIITAAAMLLTSEPVVFLLNGWAGADRAPSSSLLALLMERPAPLILFVAGVFYLWLYLFPHFDEPEKAHTV